MNGMWKHKVSGASKTVSRNLRQESQPISRRTEMKTQRRTAMTSHFTTILVAIGVSVCLAPSAQAATILIGNGSITGTSSMQPQTTTR